MTYNKLEIKVVVADKIDCKVEPDHEVCVLFEDEREALKSKVSDEFMGPPTPPEVVGMNSDNPNVAGFFSFKFPTLEGIVEQAKSVTSCAVASDVYIRDGDAYDKIIGGYEGVYAVGRRLLQINSKLSGGTEYAQILNELTQLVTSLHQHVVDNDSIRQRVSTCALNLIEDILLQVTLYRVSELGKELLRPESELAKISPKLYSSLAARFSSIKALLSDSKYKIALTQVLADYLSDLAEAKLITETVSEAIDIFNYGVPTAEFAMTNEEKIVLAVVQATGRGVDAKKVLEILEEANELSYSHGNSKVARRLQRYFYHNLLSKEAISDDVISELVQIVATGRYEQYKELLSEAVGSYLPVEYIDAQLEWFAQNAENSHGYMPTGFMFQFYPGSSVNTEDAEFMYKLFVAAEERYAATSIRPREIKLFSESLQRLKKVDNPADWLRVMHDLKEIGGEEYAAPRYVLERLRAEAIDEFIKWGKIVYQNMDSGNNDYVGMKALFVPWTIDKYLQATACLAGYRSRIPVSTEALQKFNADWAYNLNNMNKKIPFLEDSLTERNYGAELFSEIQRMSWVRVAVKKLKALRTKQAANPLRPVLAIPADVPDTYSLAEHAAAGEFQAIFRALGGDREKKGLLGKKKVWQQAALTFNNILASLNRGGFDAKGIERFITHLSPTDRAVFTTVARALNPHAAKATTPNDLGLVDLVRGFKSITKLFLLKTYIDKQRTDGVDFSILERATKVMKGKVEFDGIHHLDNYYTEDNNNLSAVIRLIVVLKQANTLGIETKWFLAAMETEGLFVAKETEAWFEALGLGLSFAKVASEGGLDYFAERVGKARGIVLQNQLDIMAFQAVPIQLEIAMRSVIFNEDNDIIDMDRIRQRDTIEFKTDASAWDYFADFWVHQAEHFMSSEREEELQEEWVEGEARQSLGRARAWFNEAEHHWSETDIAYADLSRRFTEVDTLEEFLAVQKDLETLTKNPDKCLRLIAKTMRVKYYVEEYTPWFKRQMERRIGLVNGKLFPHASATAQLLFDNEAVTDNGELTRDKDKFLTGFDKITNSYYNREDSSFMDVLAAFSDRFDQNIPAVANLQKGDVASFQIGVGLGAVLGAIAGCALAGKFSLLFRMAYFDAVGSAEGVALSLGQRMLFWAGDLMVSTLGFEIGVDSVIAPFTFDPNDWGANAIQLQEGYYHGLAIFGVLRIIGSVVALASGADPMLGMRLVEGGKVTPEIVTTKSIMKAAQANAAWQSSGRLGRIRIVLDEFRMQMAMGKLRIREIKGDGEAVESRFFGRTHRATAVDGEVRTKFDIADLNTPPKPVGDLKAPRRLVLSNRGRAGRYRGKRHVGDITNGETPTAAPNTAVEVAPPTELGLRALLRGEVGFLEHIAIAREAAAIRSFIAPGTGLTGILSFLASFETLRRSQPMLEAIGLARPLPEKPSVATEVFEAFRLAFVLGILHMTNAAGRAPDIEALNGEYERISALVGYRAFLEACGRHGVKRPRGWNPSTEKLVELQKETLTVLDAKIAELEGVGEVKELKRVMWERGYLVQLYERLTESCPRIESLVVDGQLLKISDIMGPIDAVKYPRMAAFVNGSLGLGRGVLEEADIAFKAHFRFNYSKIVDRFLNHAGEYRSKEHSEKVRLTYEGFVEAFNAFAEEAGLDIRSTGKHPDLELLSLILSKEWYRKMGLRLHSDRSGSKEAFQKLQAIEEMAVMCAEYMLQTVFSGDLKITMPQAKAAIDAELMKSPGKRRKAPKPSSVDTTPTESTQEKPKQLLQLN